MAKFDFSDDSVVLIIGSGAGGEQQVALAGGRIAQPGRIAERLDQARLALGLGRDDVAGAIGLDQLIWLAPAGRSVRAKGSVQAEQALFERRLLPAPSGGSTR